MANKLTTQQNKTLQNLTEMVESNLPQHLTRYSPSMIEEFEYLVGQGLYDSTAESIAEDLFFSNDLDEKTVFTKKKKQLQSIGVL